MLLFPAVFDIKPIWYTGVVCNFSLQGISVENPPWNLTFSMWLTVHSRNFLDIFLPVNTSKRGGHAEAWARHEGAAPTDSAAPLPQHLNSNLVQVSNTYNRGITWPSPRVPHLGPPCEYPGLKCILPLQPRWNPLWWKLQGAAPDDWHRILCFLNQSHTP